MTCEEESRKKYHGNLEIGAVVYPIIQNLIQVSQSFDRIITHGVSPIIDIQEPNTQSGKSNHHHSSYLTHLS